jgi:hypothetical protein
MSQPIVPTFGTGSNQFRQNENENRGKEPKGSFDQMWADDSRKVRRAISRRFCALMGMPNGRAISTACGEGSMPFFVHARREPNAGVQQHEEWNTKQPPVDLDLMMRESRGKSARATLRRAPFLQFSEMQTKRRAALFFGGDLDRVLE